LLARRALQAPLDDEGNAATVGQVFANIVCRHLERSSQLVLIPLHLKSILHASSELWMKRRKEYRRRDVYGACLTGIVTCGLPVEREPA